MVFSIIATKRNFYRINEILIDISFDKNIDLPKIHNFDIFPLKNIKKRFLNYLNKIKDEKFIINPDNEILNILHQIQELYSKNQIEYNEKFLARILGIISGTQFIGPQWFHLDISNPCNLDCNYCWFYSKYLKNPPSTDFKSKMINYDEFKKIINDLHKLKTDTIMFTGAGEPFMHPKINDMIKYVKDKKMKLQIFTNGTKINEESSKIIVDSNVEEILISVSASNPKTYTKVHPIHKGRIFDICEKNISNLVKYKKRIGKEKPDIVLLFVICKDNYKDIMEMADWSFIMGANTIRYQLAHNDDAKETEINNLEREYVRKEVKKVYEKYENSRMSIYSNIDFQLENTKKTLEWYNGHCEKKGCFVGWFFSRRWADDNISFCCIKKKVENTNRRNSFISLWNSKKYAKYRSSAKSFGRKNIKLKQDYYLIDKDCSHCGNYEVNEIAYNFLKDNDLIKYL